MYLIVNKQRLFKNFSTLDHKYKINEDKQIDLDHLLLEIAILQNEFYNILLIISSSDDNKKQLLFVKLQNYLSTFVEINLYFKKFDQCLSIITRLSNKSSIIISSSFFSNDNINKAFCYLYECSKPGNLGLFVEQRV
ncbi:unnamed protein product [Rotaria sordida]|uniref:Uncharacterized protein n=1 Tax=Rotaria sordida TaxID=392033 RepID=A0A815PCU0_9BILA|nr:unnamed protein product [Rotaria sordida]CAF1447490.1 unnamed protein product [Rotaria sordida]